MCKSPLGFHVKALGKCLVCSWVSQRVLQLHILAAASEQMLSGTTETVYGQVVDPHDCSTGFGQCPSQYIPGKKSLCEVLGLRQSGKRQGTDPKGSQGLLLLWAPT